MAAKTRPTACCASAMPPTPLPAATEERLVAGLRAIADPTRLRIVRLLAAQDAPLCACDVVEHVGLSQPTVSHHMKTLADAGLVVATRQGVWAYYALDPQGLADVRDLLGQLVAPPVKRKSA